MPSTNKDVAIDTRVLTIDDLEQRQPLLGDTLRAAWGQGMLNYVSYKRRIASLVGWDAQTDDEALRSEQAYVVALAELTNALTKHGERRPVRIVPKRSSYSRPWPGRVEPAVPAVHFSKLSGDKTYECWQGFSLDGQVDCITRSLGLDHRQCGWRGFEATTKQEEFLQEYGQWYTGMRRGAASDAIMELFVHDREMDALLFGPSFHGLGVPESGATDGSPKTS